MNLIADPLKQYLTLIKVGIFAVLLAAAFVGGCSHERDNWTQKWADRNAEDKRIADAARAKQLVLDAAAKAAREQREQELKDLRQYRDDHPVGPVRLCVPRPIKLPSTPGPLQGDGGSGAGTGPIQPLPAGDSPGGQDGETAGPDISGMLDALAARSDYVSAGLREWQHR